MQTRALFLSLLRSGLWAKPADISGDLSSDDWKAVLKMAKGQAVTGLIADAYEYSEDILRSAGLVSSRELMKPLIISVVEIERNNAAAERVMHSACDYLTGLGIKSVVVKGQGLGRLYPRPRHRSCGDIDLAVSLEDYPKAREIMLGYADKTDSEDTSLRHLAIWKNWILIELHGTLDARINSRIDKEIRLMQAEMFAQEDFTGWNDVLLPSAEFDAVFVFIHILQHFYNGGIGFRQICDWCRFLSERSGEIDRDILRAHLLRMKVMPEWKVFGNMAVRHLGMPPEKMPFYDGSASRKADKLLGLIFQSGNFGMIRGRDTSRDGSYIGKKYTSLLMATEGYTSKFAIFPRNTLAKVGYYLSGALRKLFKGV